MKYKFYRVVNNDNYFPLTHREDSLEIGDIVLIIDVIERESETVYKCINKSKEEFLTSLECLEEINDFEQLIGGDGQDLIVDSNLIIKDLDDNFKNIGPMEFLKRIHQLQSNIKKINDNIGFVYPDLADPFNKKEE